MIADVNTNPKLPMSRGEKKHTSITTLDIDKRNNTHNNYIQKRHVNYLLEIKRNNKKIQKTGSHKKESPDEKQISGAHSRHVHNNTPKMLTKEKGERPVSTLIHINKVKNCKLCPMGILKKDQVITKPRGIDARGSFGKSICSRAASSLLKNATMRRGHDNEEENKSGKIHTTHKLGTQTERKNGYLNQRKIATIATAHMKGPPLDTHFEQSARGIITPQTCTILKSKMRRNSPKGCLTLHSKEEIKGKNEFCRKYQNGKEKKCTLLPDQIGKAQKGDTYDGYRSEEENETTGKGETQIEEFQMVAHEKIKNVKSCTLNGWKNKSGSKRGTENASIKRIVEGNHIKEAGEAAPPTNSIKRCKVRTILLNKTWLQEGAITKLVSLEEEGERRSFRYEEDCGGELSNENNSGEEHSMEEPPHLAREHKKTERENQKGEGRKNLHRYKIISVKIKKGKELRKEYIITKQIGKGTFGKVCLGIHIHTHEIVAIKILNKKKLQRLISYEKIMKEIRIHEQMDHNHICKLYEAYEDGKNIYMILEYIPNGDLLSYVCKKKRRINEDTARRIFYQLISAVDYLHKFNVVHRDLKPENILLDDDENIKLIDFGLSTVYEKNNLLATSCGSPFYTSPEILQGNKYHGELTDVWSLGVILFLLLNRKLPFNHISLNVLFQEIIKGLLHFEPHISESAKNLIRNMLNVNYQKRYSLRDVKTHPWFNSYHMKKKNFTKLCHDNCHLICCNVCSYKIIILSSSEWMQLILNKIGKIYSIEGDQICSELREKGKNSVKTSFYLLLNKTIRMVSTNNSLCSHLVVTHPSVYPQGENSPPIHHEAFSSSHA
ncbi:serine/threonine protein kinase, putative [Plasmodium knowlesi strain H]|uniref:Serine/threonine protein kinase, putative n=3 Tax=Plasmodium knowlesi TaxID=5850 RepID=A0A5K1TXU5_PLAKH|nr:SNF1-related serine/threonine protein kinase KIN, putative [Plasmodium knowlesi strain H]OTN65594.1 putative Serine/threonine protein kinase [Plasmodium knowlesi]CAA9989606.1 SNF1-related serine/threonine protein kinase KIN, putative [Plasmodium knowlesi strain H]SBO22678.1 serine/threonine protein kinase, putative [Plasmodium knowlesi strain H]SBO23302.1 serine/threonine protein kinase, putative [Plasmodium knowlesi strain H]VVS79080.1 SNF1-related serine/threonine protein kinase KIN, puta|eukprot:XP_002260332.1 serine/threonine-protein kinase, putative [Plasmodium knowlesi strain H]